MLALLNRPRLVILDELTQGLDPAARRDVWAAVAQLRDAGTTVLLVTHEMDQAEALCDTVIVMRAGAVLDAGAPAALVARHAGGATVRFGWPEAERADLTTDLQSMAGVRDVSVRAGKRSPCAAIVRSSRTSARSWSVGAGSRMTSRSRFPTSKARCSNCWMASPIPLTW